MVPCLGDSNSSIAESNRSMKSTAAVGADLSCLEHTLDGTGNRAVKAITLHTFVDISLSYSYTHLGDHLRKLESPPDHCFSPVVSARISWTGT